MFISIAVGLIKLSGEQICPSLKRYESSDSLVLSGYSSGKLGFIIYLMFNTLPIGGIQRFN